jgi:hypothetical protein
MAISLFRRKRVRILRLASVALASGGAQAPACASADDAQQRECRELVGRHRAASDWKLAGDCGARFFMSLKDVTLLRVNVTPLTRRRRSEFQILPFGGAAGQRTS